MSEQGVTSRKRRGPAPAGKGTSVVVRIHADQLAELDAWAERHGKLSRPEAIRRLIEQGMGESTHLMRSS